MRKYPVAILAILGVIVEVVTTLLKVGQPLTVTVVVTAIVTALQHSKVYSPATVGNLFSQIVQVQEPSTSPTPPADTAI